MPAHSISMGAALRHQDVSHMRRIKDMEAEHAVEIGKLQGLLRLAVAALEQAGVDDVAEQIRAELQGVAA